MGMIDREETLKAMDTWDKFGYLANHGLIRLGKENKYYVQYVRYEDMVKAVKGMPTVQAIPKADYENRLKADLVAMLTEIQLEIEEIKPLEPTDDDDWQDWQYGCFHGLELMQDKCLKLIQQKISSLKEKPQ